MKVLISGASRGVGRAIARQFAKEENELFLLSRTKSDLQLLKEELDGKCKVHILPIDLSDQQQIERFSLQDFKGDELSLVNNVGTYSREELSNLDRTAIEKLMAVNLYGTIELTNKLLAQLRAAKNASIFNISSINGLMSDPGATAYSITKHSMKAWNDALREELRKDDIKVTAFYPGPISTSSWEGMDVDLEAMIQAEDIARMIETISTLSKGSLVEEVRMSPLNFRL